MQFRPLKGKVLVKPFEDKSGGLIQLPKKERQNCGMVALLPTDYTGPLKEKMVCWWKTKWHGEELSFDGSVFLSLDEKDIVMIMEE
jgi:co-chaperonin GroES (HSP10)